MSTCEGKSSSWRLEVGARGDRCSDATTHRAVEFATLAHAEYKRLRNKVDRRKANQTIIRLNLPAALFGDVELDTVALDAEVVLRHDSGRGEHGAESEGGPGEHGDAGCTVLCDLVCRKGLSDWCLLLYRSLCLMSMSRLSCLGKEIEDAARMDDIYMSVQACKPMRGTCVAV